MTPGPITSRTSNTARFSPSDAAFEGVRLVGRRPDVLAIWMLLQMLLVAASLLLSWNLFGRDFQALVALFRSHPNAGQVLPFMQKVRVAQGLLTPLSLVVQAVFGAAIVRAVIRPDSRAPGYLGLGADEFRLFLVQLVLGLVIGAGVAAWALLVVVLTAIAIAAAGFRSSEMSAPILCAVIAGGGGGIVGLVVVSVRLSLAPAMTFAEGRFRFFESWGLTRGLFWSLLGAYVLAFFLSLVVTLILFVLAALAGGAVFVAMGGLGFIATHGFSDDLPGMAWPAILVALVPIGLSGVLNTLILRAPAAYAYRAVSMARD